jgi:molecular chaperone GrpE (heat shock protein)
MENTWGPEFVTDPTAEAEVPVEEHEDDDDLIVPPPPNARPQSPDKESLGKALRELEAAKARVERDAHKAQNEMREQLVMQLLPVLDNLDRTISAAQGAPSVIDGVRLVRRQIIGVLEGFGLRRLEALHQRFDPAIHEAISVAPVRDPRQDGLIVDQLEPGYAMGDKLLRAARVIVGRAQRYH